MVRFDFTELRKYGGLMLIARQVVEGFLGGVHRSPFKGVSIEFAEHRQYSPGDEIRHIDWRAYGKTDRYFIKEYEEETNLKAYLLVDASGSMAFRGSRKRVSKFEYAQHVAASLAYLMLHQQDAIGLVTLDTRVRALIPPRSTPKHLLHVLRTLESTRPGGETALAPLWHELAAHHLRRRGMVIILSDFFEEVESLTLALRHLRHRSHEVLLFHILAPEEIEFPYRRLTRFRNLELGSDRLLVDPRRVRSEYVANFERFCERLRGEAGKMRIDYHLLRTDEPVDRAVGAYLAQRRKKG